MRGEIIENLDFEEYKNCLLANGNDTFFHSMNHLKYLEDVLNIKSKFIAVKENSKIKGILPFFF